MDDDLAQDILVAQMRVQSKITGRPCTTIDIYIDGPETVCRPV